MDKNLFFYSKHCPHSRQVLSVLNEKRIGSDLLRICIDTNNIRIPSFITCVPSIYLTRSKQILTGDYLTQWLHRMKKKQQTQKLTPYCMENSSFTGCFSFLKGEDQVPNFNFSNIESQDMRMNTPQMMSEDKKGIMKNYEALLQSRGQLDNAIRRI